MNGNINYICSTVFCELDTLYSLIFKYRKELPHIFNDDFSICAVRGTFNNLPWEATDFYHGRNWLFDTYASETIQLSIGKTPSMENIKKTLLWYQKNNIQVQLELSNILLEENDMFDRYGNLVLRTFQEMGPSNVVVVSSPVLEDYIADNYPEIPIIKDISSDQELQQFFKYHKMYAGASLNKRYNVDINLLQAAEPSIVDKIDVVTNAKYDLLRDRGNIQRKINSMRSLFIDEEAILQDFSEQQTDESGPIFGIESTNKKMSLVNAAENTYKSAGINKFRIESTGVDAHVLKETIMHLVKPQYQADLYAEILSEHYRKPSRY